MEEVCLHPKISKKVFKLLNMLVIKLQKEKEIDELISK